MIETLGLGFAAITVFVLLSAFVAMAVGCLGMMLLDVWDYVQNSQHKLLAASSLTLLVLVAYAIGTIVKGHL